MSDLDVGISAEVRLIYVILIDPLCKMFYNFINNILQIQPKKRNKK